MEPEAKRPRKPNWTFDEIHLLLQELLVEGNALFAANTPSNTTKAKAATWRAIAVKVAALGISQRTSEEIKLKWKSLRKDVIEKDAECRVTGGGKPKPKLIPFEDLVRQVLGDKSNSYSGINVTGCDSSIFSAIHQEQTPERHKNVSTSGGEQLVNIAIHQQGQCSSSASASIMDIPVYLNSDAVPLPFDGDEAQQSMGSKYEMDNSFYSKNTSHYQQGPSIKELSAPHVVTDTDKEDPAVTSTPTSRPRGWKTRQLKQKRQAGSRRLTPSTSNSRDIMEEEDALFKEYLKSEITKNNTMVEKMKKDMEESAERIALYKNMNQKYMEDRQEAFVTFV